MQEKNYNFSPEKNAWLIEKRGISFEEVIAAISIGALLDIIKHPNQAQYGHQKMYVVYVRDYVYLVPFVEQEEGWIFLKTIIPSRKARKIYLTEGDQL